MRVHTETEKILAETVKRLFKNLTRSNDRLREVITERRASLYIKHLFK